MNDGQENIALQKAAGQPAESKLGNWNFLPRGLALFLGGFSLLNLLGDFRSAGFDANLWWIDLRPLPQFLAKAVLLISGLSFIGFAIRTPRSLWRRCLTVSCSALLGAVSVVNALGFYVLLARGRLGAGIPIPLSLFVSAALATILLASLRPAAPRAESRPFIPVLAVCFACGLAFPIAQMFCF